MEKLYKPLGYWETPGGRWEKMVRLTVARVVAQALGKREKVAHLEALYRAEVRTAAQDRLRARVRRVRNQFEVGHTVRCRVAERYHLFMSTVVDPLGSLASRVARYGAREALRYGREGSWPEDAGVAVLGERGVLVAPVVEVDNVGG